jgi:hypothetical protein
LSFVPLSGRDPVDNVVTSWSGYDGAPPGPASDTRHETDHRDASDRNGGWPLTRCAAGRERRPLAGYRDRVSGSDRLPGEELVRRGLADLERGTESVESLLVSIGAPRLRSLGWTVDAPIPDAEERLYLALRDEHGDAAHSRYNALVRRLVSFERAAASRARAGA